MTDLGSNPSQAQLTPGEAQSFPLLSIPEIDRIFPMPSTHLTEQDSPRIPPQSDTQLTIESVIEAHDDQPWLDYPNPEMRQVLADMERSSDKDNNGYGEINDATDALGRYQLMPVALQDAGWQTPGGIWTPKANAAGVYNEDDFLNNPDAQESALTDALARDWQQIRSKGDDSRIGDIITDENGQSIIVTVGGLILAAHKEGAGAVNEYFSNSEENNNSTVGQNLTGAFLNIENRLRTGQFVNYNPKKTEDSANLTGRQK